MQFYIEDLIERGGKATLQRGMDVIMELMKDVGALKLTERATKEEASRRLTRAERKRMEKEAEEKIADWLERHSTEFVKLARDAIDIKMAYERGLALHSIVVATAAFEDYVQSVTISTIERSDEVEKRFGKQLQERLTYEDIRTSYGNTRRAVAEVVAHSVSFSNPDSVLLYLEKLTAATIADDRQRWVRLYGLYQDYRNLAAHTAGIVDTQFQHATGYPGPVGKPVRISQQFAEGALSFFQNTVRRIQLAIDRQLESGQNIE
ncbi:MAG TPA: hypothetical protein VEH57_08560 [Thermoplasmata archaeon]|nr:hypothetical protein [Thermoplasmata archaeon]